MDGLWLIIAIAGYIVIGVAVAGFTARWDRTGDSLAPVAGLYWPVSICLYVVLVVVLVVLKALRALFNLCKGGE